MYGFNENEFESYEYDPNKDALCAVIFSPFYSSLEKGQLYIFRVGSGQVNPICCFECF
jgi:hypothetical protein